MGDPNEYLWSEGARLLARQFGRKPSERDEARTEAFARGLNDGWESAKAAGMPESEYDMAALRTVQRLAIVKAREKYPTDTAVGDCPGIRLGYRDGFLRGHRRFRLGLLPDGSPIN